MLYQVLANAVLLLHLLFILFVVAGALLLFRWPVLAWLHLPCVAWGVLIECNQWICPLTPLENYFRQRAGQAGYEAGFLEHYLSAVIYPGGLTANVQVLLAFVVIALNLTMYVGIAYWNFRKRKKR